MAPGNHPNKVNNRFREAWIGFPGNKTATGGSTTAKKYD